MAALIFALLLRIVSNPFANLFQKKLSEFESSLTVNFYSSIFLALFCVPFLGKLNWGEYSPLFFGLVLSAGVLCFLGTICLIKALSLGEMSVLGPVNSYKSVVGLVFGFVFLGEVPSLRGIFGFLIIISASFLFLDEKGRFILNKSVALRFLALIFAGIEAVILKKIILLSSPLEGFIFWCLTGVLFSGGFALLFKKAKLSRKNSIGFCALIGVLLFIMQFSTNFVFKNLEVGLSLALFQLSNVISLILGFKFFREKGILKKSVGTFLMLLGSFLILF